ncbi:HAD family hydrolase [Anaeromyxobacter oryzae]|uniref:Haloacid dehalogenase domain protein hydrolase n=1 Tax=Anaeromyxobacter oryzae TaxID=2918170 RepID=A0ABN6MQ22_9BACT|nr:HAD family hydrolase [Anaeromyxobacter oryzae]BDG01710.1 hypothetical protein AMOR_07060 [Anaeromyxobacter oryzae]
MPALVPAPVPTPSPRSPLEPQVVPELDPADPRADPRLAPLLALVEARDVAVLSLDFFDTLCGRAVPAPPVAFLRVGEVLRAAGLLPRAVDPAAFVAIRVGAERRARVRARTAGRGTEIRLAEIYAELPAALLAPEHRARAAALEVKVEAAVALPDPAVLALARRAKARGVRVAIVSDSYLAAGDLLAILRAAGAPLAPDLVLTSSDAGTCKAERLFDVLVARLGVPARRIAHLGDSYEADVLGAARAGLRAFHLPQADDALRHARAREDALTLESPAPDGGLAWLRARAGVRATAVAVPADLADAYRLGATVFGPVFTGFADWVADRLAAHRCAGAVFFMREGAFLSELVARTLAARGERRRCTPLWISRQSAFRAAIPCLDEAAIRDALVRRVRPTAAELCATFGVAPGEVGLAGRANVPLESEGAVSAVVAALLRPAARARIEAKLAEQRALLRAHLAEAAPFPGPVACVDLGWGGTIQRLLARALAADRADRPLVGLYLAATVRAADVLLDGGVAAGYVASPGRADRFAELLGRSPEVLEQLCLPPVGSVLGYARGAGGRPEPLLERRAPDPEGDRSRAAVRAGILQFQAQHLRLARPAHGPIPAHAARAVLVRLLVSPSPEEARLLGAWRHDDNFGTAAGGAIAPALPAAEVDARAPDALYDDRSLYWPAAVAARASRRAADALSAYALLGLFGPGPAPGADALETPLRYRLADQLDGIVRRWAPALRDAARRAAVVRLRLAEPVVPPLRHRAADAVNDAAKRTVPRLHARAKRVLGGALVALARAEAGLLAAARGAGVRART